MNTVIRNFFGTIRSLGPYLGLALLGLSVLSTGARATGAVVEKPIYYERTGSYYEMIDFRPTTGGYGIRWSDAETRAQAKTLGGVRGRLALIKSPETELFLKVNLRPDHATWFGLYFDCDSRRFHWIDGTPMQNTDYANFLKDNWYREPTGTICSDYRGYRRYPVFLDMSADKRWAVRGPTKLFYYFIIEYPTGGRVEDAASHSATDVPPAPKAE